MDSLHHNTGFGSSDNLRLIGHFSDILQNGLVVHRLAFRLLFGIQKLGNDLRLLNTASTYTG